MSVIVWLEIDGKLEKCMVTDSAGLEFRYIASCISMARADDLHDAVTYWTNERIRIAKEIVKSGQYQVTHR